MRQSVCMPSCSHSAITLYSLYSSSILHDCWAIYFTVDIQTRVADLIEKPGDFTDVALQGWKFVQDIQSGVLSG